MKLVSKNDDRRFEYELEQTTHGIVLHSHLFFGDQMVSTSSINLPAQDVIDWVKDNLNSFDTSNMKFSDDAHRSEFKIARLHGYNHIIEYRLHNLLKQAAYLWLNGAELDNLLQLLGSHAKSVINARQHSTDSLNCCPECSIDSYVLWLESIWSLIPGGLPSNNRHTEISRFKGMSPTRIEIYSAQQEILYQIRNNDILDDNVVRVLLLDLYNSIHQYLDVELTDATNITTPFEV